MNTALCYKALQLNLRHGVFVFFIKAAETGFEDSVPEVNYYDVTFKGRVSLDVSLTRSGYFLLEYFPKVRKIDPT